MKKYLDRLKQNLSIKDFDSKQPIRIWMFVLLLNIIGFAGYFFLRLH